MHRMSTANGQSYWVSINNIYRLADGDSLTIIGKKGSSMSNAIVVHKRGTTSA